MKNKTLTIRKTIFLRIGYGKTENDILLYFIESIPKSFARLPNNYKNISLPLQVRNHYGNGKYIDIVRQIHVAVTRFTLYRFLC